MGEGLTKDRELVQPMEEEDSLVVSPKVIGQMQELWLVLSKRDWASLVVLPVDGDASTKGVACLLADAGSSLSDVPVSAITASELVPGSARALVTLAQQVGRRQDHEWTKDDVIDVSPIGADPLGQLIISVPSLSLEPVALVVAHAADMVVLGIQLGKTKMKELNRTIELIGRERIGGCILLEEPS